MLISLSVLPANALSKSPDTFPLPTMAYPQAKRPTPSAREKPSCTTCHLINGVYIATTLGLTHPMPTQKMAFTSPGGGPDMPLLAYQFYTVGFLTQHLLSREPYVILGHQPGLGKTAMALATVTLLQRTAQKSADLEAAVIDLSESPPPLSAKEMHLNPKVLTAHSNSKFSLCLHRGVDQLQTGPRHRGAWNCVWECSFLQHGHAWSTDDCTRDCSKTCHDCWLHL